jgi:acylphosphatase
MRHLTHIIVRGRVQGVSFRAWAVREASNRGVDGWVRNREDGSVEAMLAGEPMAVRSVVQACRGGPAMAVVTDLIELPAEEPDPGPGFHIRY